VKKNLIALIFLVTISKAWSQQEEEPIEIVYGGNFTKNELKYPGASIFSKDDERQLEFLHKGAQLWCDVALFYQQENKIKAIGNIKLVQGDTLELKAKRLDYDGSSLLAKSWDQVSLTTPQMKLKTDTLYFNRAIQEAYYDSGGIIKDEENTLKSLIGRYDTKLKKYIFKQNVHLTNPEYELNSEKLDYHTQSKHAYLYGPSKIIAEDYSFYCERGFYNTILQEGYGIKNTTIKYDNRIIKGDSVYLNHPMNFASATNNIKITDTINNGVLRAHYAEIYKDKDSLFATKRALSISLVENDSLYMHGDTIMVTGKKDQKIIRAFQHAKFFKKGLSGKCDSIHFNQLSGITELIRKPILWNGPSQMTGKEIYLISNPKTKELDSLKVIDNAFIVSLDSIGKKGYNQIKGKLLNGSFKDNQLKHIQIDQNTEVIYYVYDDNNELLGINQTICSAVIMEMEEGGIVEISFVLNPEGQISPLKDTPIEDRKLEGFLWYGSEQIKSPDDLFEEDDFELKIINGLNQELSPTKSSINSKESPLVKKPKKTN